jgi:putative glutamine amidotransferase
MAKKAGISKCDSNFEPYLRWLEYAGIEYIVLDYIQNNFEDIKKCSSLVLTGGVDIFPEFYNDWEEGRDRTKYKPERDGFEFKLLDYVLDKKIPLLAICRGLQLINCKLNGSLINDLETVRNVNHKKISEKQDREHSVNVFENTLLYDVVQQKEGIVNSSHHQAIDRLGEGLVVTSKSPDGIIESIEFENKINSPFFIGVQWHPERMTDSESPFTKNLSVRLKTETEKS